MGKKLKKKQKPSKAQKARYSIQKDPEQLSVSACLMVKNEEKDIKRCLTSLLSHVDRVYILDTGSTDKTPEICESLGCIVNYLDNPDDYFIETRFGRMLNFSKARNKALSYVEGDWVISIDADEVFDWAGIDSLGLRKFLALQPKRVEAINVDMNDMQQGRVAMVMTVAKIFRVGKVKYVNIVHNKAVVAGGAVIWPGPFINHYGYDEAADPQKRKDKIKRTIGLLEERINQNPSDWEAWFYVGQQYILDGDYNKGISACERYVSFKKQAQLKRNFNSTVYYSAAKTLLDLGRFQEASHWIQQGLQENARDMDLAYALTVFGVGVKRNDLVLKGAEQYLACYDEFSKNPRFNYGKFNLTFNPNMLCNALHALTMARLQSGVETMMQLDRAMNNATPEKRDSIYSGLVQDLDTAGIGQLVKVMGADKIINQSLSI